MMQRDSGTLGSEHPSWVSLALQEKVVDFVAWRRARPRPLTNEGLTNDGSSKDGRTNDRPAEIVPIFKTQVQMEVAGLLPAFDYAGHQRPAPRRPGAGMTSSGLTPSGMTSSGTWAGLTPGAANVIAATAPNAATLSAVLALLSAPGPEISQRGSLATEARAAQVVVTERVVSERVVTGRGVTETVVTEPAMTQAAVTAPIVTAPIVTKDGVTQLAAVRQAAAEKAQAQKAAAQTSFGSKWSPRRWPSGLAWLVSSMSDGVMDVENLQTILSDMQQELDALDASIQRLRKDDDYDFDLNDLDDGTESAATGERRICDMTGRATEAVARLDHEDGLDRQDRPGSSAQD